MANIQIDTSQTASWQRLVQDAQNKCKLNLTENLESYLVFMLIRFTKHHSLAKSILAIDYLNSQALTGNSKQEQLRDVGDKCLLFSGFFPEQAERRLVSVTYFIELGRGAYYQIAEETNRNKFEGLSALYAELSSNFISLSNILQEIKGVDNSSINSSVINKLDKINNSDKTIFH